MQAIIKKLFLYGCCIYQILCIVLCCQVNQLTPKKMTTSNTTAKIQFLGSYWRVFNAETGVLIFYTTNTESPANDLIRELNKRKLPIVNPENLTPEFRNKLKYQ